MVLIRLPQVAGPGLKLRPALVLTTLPGPYQSALLAGVSTHLRSLQPEWDELVDSGDSDFASSGLRFASAVRLSFLYAAAPGEILGTIGRIEAARLDRLCARLANQLTRRRQ
jgi:hypothetical protein